MIAILVIEDNEDDIVLFRMALKQEGIKNPVQVVHNGKEALEYLQSDGEYGDRSKFPFPGIIFTDLKMPVMGGFGVLEWLKTHPAWSTLPVMVLSSSDDGSDIEKAYRLGANAYMVKPSTLEGLRKLVRTAHEFWQSCEKPKLKL